MKSDRPGATIAAGPRPSHAPRREVRALAALFLLGVAALLYSGCSLIGGQVAAKVGSRTLTLKEYQQMLGALGGGVTPPDSVRRRMLVDDWADKQLLFLEAESLHLDTTAAVVTELKDRLDRLAVQEIYTREVTSKVKITDAMVRSLYDRRKESRVLARILVPTLAVADSVRKLIGNGMSFEQAAFMNSLDKASSANGGMAGEVSPGDLPSEIEDAVWAVKAGEITKPVRSQGGYDLIKVLAIRKADQRPYEQEKTQLEATLKNRMMYDATIKLLDGLKEQRKFVILDDDIKRLSDAMMSAKQAGSDTIPPFTPTQLAQPLARYEGGPYTIGQFLHDVRTSAGRSRPNLLDLRDIRQFVENRAGLQILADEAQRRGLARDPGVQKSYGNIRDNLLAQVLITRVLGSPRDPGDAELHQEYETHKSEYVNQGSASVYRLATADRHQAEEAAKEARANVDFASLQRRYSRPTAEELKEGEDIFIHFDATNTTLADSLRTRGQDGIVGPVSQGGRFFVYKIHSVYPPLNSTFEEARGTLAQRVRLTQENRTLREHIDQLRKRWPPSINDKVVLTATPAPPEKTGQEQDN